MVCKPNGLMLGYTSMLQVNSLLDFSLYIVYIHVGMILGTK